MQEIKKNHTGDDIKDKIVLEPDNSEENNYKSRNIKNPIDDEHENLMMKKNAISTTKRVGQSKSTRV